MSSTRIMIVDDDPGMILELQTFLQDLGYRVEGSAFTSAEAIKKAEALRPDLVIMDIQLDNSGMDGIQTAKTIYQAYNIPSVYLTGHADDQTLARVMESGAFGYILKPFKEKELIAALELAICKYREQKVLEAGQADLQEIVRKIVDGIILTDSNGIILFANPAAEKIFGKKIEQWAGEKTGFVFPAGQTSEIMIENSGGKKNIEVYVTQTDWQSKPAFLMSLRDITERKKAEEQYRRIQRMQSIGMLAGGVVHDLTNYLTVMKGYCDMMGNAPEEKKKQILKDMQEATERIGGLARQLMVFSRKETKTPTVCDVNSIILSAEKMLRLLISGEIELAISQSPDLWQVRMDPQQFEQVLVNLAANARDAMQGSGKITIETRNVNFEESAYSPHFLKGDYVQISVIDNGAGMTAEVKEHLFEPFFTTKPEGKGTGFGLANSYGIIRQYGGDIYVESELNRGTVFKIVLPRAKN